MNSNEEHQSSDDTLACIRLTFGYSAKLNFGSSLNSFGRPFNLKVNIQISVEISRNQSRRPSWSLKTSIMNIFKYIILFIKITYGQAFSRVETEEFEHWNRVEFVEVSNLKVCLSYANTVREIRTSDLGQMVHY